MYMHYNNITTIFFTSFRDSKKAPYQWKEMLTFGEVKRIQLRCAKALNLWGYKYYTSEKEMRNSSLTDSLLPYWKFGKVDPW